MLKPIETCYRGYRFRSRLEARWAVFLDHLGLNWLYEPEGFTLPTGDRYLPDFLLPDNKHMPDVYLEVKPHHPIPRDETKKLWEFGDALLATKPAIGFLVAVGLPGDACGPMFFRGSFVETRKGGPIMLSDFLALGYKISTQSFSAAVNAARSARFEFGQSGTT